MVRALRARAIVWAAAVAAVVLVLGLLADRLYAAHGLDATYYASPAPGRRIAVVRTVEHRTRFPTDHRVLSRVVQAWDYETYGVPAQLFPLDVQLSGTLTVPEGPQLFIASRTKNRP